MKNFKLKPVQLSKSADMKIKTKLFMLQIKKNFEWLKLLRVAPVVFVFAFMVIGVYQILDRDEELWNQDILVQTEQVQKTQKPSRLLSELREIRTEKYRAIARKRLYTQKAERYKQYAYVRVAWLRGK